MLSLIARKAGGGAAAAAAETLSKCAAARLLSTEGASSQQKSAQQQRKPRDNSAARSSGKGHNLLFGEDKQQQSPMRKKKTFSFRNKADKKEPEPELEVFDYPSYWDVDFPADFDDAMKHEVEKLQIFSDFTPFLDRACRSCASMCLSVVMYGCSSHRLLLLLLMPPTVSWQKEIHELFDGEDIKMALNCPLEDFDERLFIDDKNTYDTKVVMEVPLSCFKGLDKDGLEIVKQLAGPRYNANKQQLKLTEDRYPTRVFNHKRLCDILRDLTQTAHELSSQAKATSA